MINKSEQTLDNRLVEEIAHMKRELNALKTRQLLGGDNLVVDVSNTVSADLTILAGESAALTLTVTPADGRLSLMEPAWSLYIYGTSLPNPDYLIPNGSLVSMSLRHETRTEWREDLSLNDDNSGIKRFILTVHNDATVATRVFLFQAKIYSPKRSLA